jgi:sec-independent protein translocase protein TatA
MLLLAPADSAANQLGKRHMMGDIGVPELLIILAIAIVLFGPSRIGGVGKSLGEAIRNLRQAVRNDEPTAATDEPAAAQPPLIEDQALLRESARPSE